MRHAYHIRMFAPLVALAALLVAAAPAIAGPFTRLQVLLPGETAAPGTGSGKTGTPKAQTVGVPFNVTVRACDSSWNLVNTATDVVHLLSSDASATLPGATQLQSGSLVLAATLNAGGTFTFFAHDETDGTIPDGTSAAVSALVIQGFQFSGISQKNQTAGVPFTMTLTARSPSGAIVTGYNGYVRLKETTSFGDGRTVPDSVQLVNGTWTGGLAALRADETSINRGNANFYAFLSNAPSKNGTSDPFTVHPGAFSRVQLIVPGETALPSSVSGKIGTPASQSAGQAFAVTAYSTDAYWNQVFSGDNVRLTSSDGAASTPITVALSNGVKVFNVTLGTVGTQTLTLNDQTNAGITGMTSPGISVIPNAVHHFAINTISSPQVAGTPLSVTIRAADVSNNTVPGYDGQAVLSANTGAGSISPELITFTNGVWTGNMVFRGAGGAVSFTAFDFSAPPHTGTSNSFVVQPGPFAGLQVLLPGETPQGGTVDGKNGSPTNQTAGSAFTLTLRAVDAYWNLVSGVNDRVKLGSSDLFATMPSDTSLIGGQLLMPVKLYRTGPQRIWASDSDNVSITPDTSAYVTVIGGAFSRVLILAPGESPAPGTATGRTGTATDESINYAFTCTAMATDQWWNPVGGVTDVVHITSGDPLATLPPDAAMVDGVAQMNVKLATGGFQQISVSDVTQPSKTGSTTQVRAISTGFHLEAAITPSTAPAGGPFTLTVKVTNDAGSVIQEINSFVTIDVQNASSQAPGRGTLLTTQFQLLQGQRSVSESYTFAEPIVVVAHDDAGNAPAVSNVITITPGAPSQVLVTSVPTWVGGDKNAAITARVTDDYSNGVPNQPVNFLRLSGTGTLSAIDSSTDSVGAARANFLSPRQPETDRIRAVSGALSGDLDLVTAFVDPNAPGGTVTNYPNPFHPPGQGTTLAYKLDDDAQVTIRIFTQSGELVRREEFARGAVGGSVGLNSFVWDGKNGAGNVVASGGYIVLLEAHGTGNTLNVMRRKIAVVR
ncbi:MAG TPA: FlgD immunoglobulin-like domain containing protein [Candidatus Saccharimonadaceae bacterium]|nr:FlgD immunoglobulin-like domain containing protein [Candidatus Saccharimonadaceae bacterium]